MLEDKHYTPSPLHPFLSRLSIHEELKLRQSLAETTHLWVAAEAEIIKLRGLLAQNGIEINAN